MHISIVNVVQNKQINFEKKNFRFENQKKKKIVGFFFFTKATDKYSGASE